MLLRVSFLVLLFVLLFPTQTHADTSRAFVTNSNSNDVSVIDPNTNTVLTTIPVGARPYGMISYGNHVYVANSESSSISVIDANTNTVTATIPVTGYPYNLAINSNETKLYVADFGAATNTVSVIDTASNTVLTTLSGFCIPVGITVSPDNAYLYVVSRNDNPACGSGNGNGWVTVINASTYATVATIQLSDYPNDIEIAPGGAKAYVTSGAFPKPTVTYVIDLSTNQVTNTITTGVNGYDVEFNPTGTKAYVLSSYYSTGGNSTLSVIDTSSETVEDTVHVGINSSYLAITPDGSQLYVANAGSNSISVIDATTKVIVDEITSSDVPWDVVFATVNNEAPVVGTVTISPDSIQTNTTVNATATFTDAGTGDAHTATVVWETGGTPFSCNIIVEPTGSNPGTLSCSKPSGYATANVYPVTITVSDGTASGTSPIAYASVYTPMQSSIFNAGQRFNSPLGAYQANLSLTGEVRFGLNYRYQGSTPVGQKQFSVDFDDANLHFNATTVSSLVISGSTATLRGTGMINGSGTYNYLVTGVDGGGIRIQIKDTSNNLIYDTQPNAADTATPTTSVNGHVKVQ